MAHIKLSSAYSVAEYDGFKGIDGSLICPGGIKSMTNFRINSDGSIKRRDGFAPLVQLPGTPLAIYRTSENELIALISNSYYSINLSTQQYTKLGTLQRSASSKAEFVEIGGNLYLSSGNDLYVYQDGAFNSVNGYVPLYGKDWDCEAWGEVNEPLNLLSNRVRISFDLSTADHSIIDLPFKITSVDAAFCDGELSTRYEYVIANSGTRILSEVLESGVGVNKLTLFMTLDSSVIDKSELLRCGSARSYGSSSKGSAAVFYNGQDQGVIFPSRPIDTDEYKKVKEIYPDALEIFVSGADKIKLKDSRSKVTAVCPTGNDVIIFTERSAYLLSVPGASDNNFSLLSNCFGCPSKSGAALINDEVVSVSRSGVIKWTPSKTEDRTYEPICISNPVSDQITLAFASSAVVFHDQIKNEIWVCNPSRNFRLALIYSIDKGLWFSFDNIEATEIFEFNGEICFLKEKVICGFSPSSSRDDNGSASGSIRASLESGLIMSSPINESKKLLRCIVRSSSGITASLAVRNAVGDVCTISLSDTSGEYIGYVEKRVNIKKSRYYRFSLSTNSDAVIYGVTFIAQK